MTILHVFLLLTYWLFWLRDNTTMEAAMGNSIPPMMQEGKLVIDQLLKHRNNNNRRKRKLGSK